MRFKQTAIEEESWSVVVQDKDLLHCLSTSALSMNALRHFDCKYILCYRHAIWFSVKLLFTAYFIGCPCESLCLYYSSSENRFLNMCFVILVIWLLINFYNGNVPVFYAKCN